MTLIKTLEDNQVKVQPNISESYISITKALVEKRTEFHIYKLKEQRNYRVVLKICSTPLTLKKSKLKLRNQDTVTNIWNIKHYRTKQPLSMFFVDLKPAPNSKGIFNVNTYNRAK
jgi:hypothetical protein